MKSWKNRNQEEFHVDNVEISGDRMTVVMHHHFGESRATVSDDKAAATIADLAGRRVLVTFAEFVQVAGLNEKKKDLPGQTGGENTK